MCVCACVYVCVCLFVYLYVRVCVCARARECSPFRHFVIVFVWTPAPPAQPPEPDDKDASALAEISLINKLLHSKGLVNSINDIEVQRKDPTSPLYSAKSFEELHLKPNLLKGLYSMGFNKPSKIQETTLPLLLADPLSVRMYNTTHTMHTMHRHMHTMCH